MSDATKDRLKAQELPEGDVIRLLLEQHAQVRELFDEVTSASGDARKEKFDELRALLAVHETAEEMVLRPVTKDVAGEQVADARNHEESEANEVLKQLENMDVTSPEFEEEFAQFHKAVDSHADSEETEEFPQIIASCDEDQRSKMGSYLKAAEATAPTHPHPSAAGSTAAQYAAGPFASLVDRTRDAISKAMG